MRAFILLLALLVQLYSSGNPTTTLLSIDLEIDEDTIYRIKTEEDETLKYYVSKMYKTRIPKKYLDLIKEHLDDNGFKCKTKIFYSGGIYYKFYCPDNTSKDFSKIKLHFNFEDQTITLNESQLFEIKNNQHHSLLITQKNLVTLHIGLGNTN